MSEISEIESTLDWWREAGVDVIVDDRPRSWLKDTKKPRPKPDETGEAPPVLTPMPDTLPEFRQWMLESDIITAPADQRLDAAGDPASGLMILVDMPEQHDAGAEQLVSGEAGLLLDRMLAAIGRDRASIYLATLSPARSPGGAISDAAIEALGKAARHHVALAAPKSLLLMGDAPSRVFCEAGLNKARAMKHNINHDGGSVTAIATFHPRFLLQQPKFKAECWKDLQMLIEGMNA